MVRGRGEQIGRCKGTRSRGVQEGAREGATDLKSERKDTSLLCRCSTRSWAVLVRASRRVRGRQDIMAGPASGTTQHRHSSNGRTEAKE